MAGFGLASTETVRFACCPCTTWVSRANSEVFPCESVAVAETNWPMTLGTGRVTLIWATPLASVVSWVCPSRVCPSPKLLGSRVGLM